MKTKQLLSVLFLSFLLPLASQAGVWQDPETKVNYEYTVGKNEAQVNGSPDVSGDIAILSNFTVDGNEYTVTRIVSNAFSGCTLLYSIQIPSTVTNIGSSAFYGCTGLITMEIPSSVTAIASSAFDGCTGLESVTIPSSVTRIGDCAFEGCTGLMYWTYLPVW